MGPEDQPDDDIHGECRHEIERLEQQLAALRENLKGADDLHVLEYAEIERLKAENKARDELAAECAARRDHDMAVLSKASDLVRHSRMPYGFSSDSFRMTWKEFETAVMTRAADTLEDKT